MASPRSARAAIIRRRRSSGKPPGALRFPAQLLAAAGMDYGERANWRDIMLTDARGLTVTAASPDAVAALDATVAAYCGMRLDTGDQLKRALAADPNFLFAHTLKGYFMMLFAKRDFVGRAAQALAAAEAAAQAVGGTPRELRPPPALRRRGSGDWRPALARRG